MNKNWKQWQGQVAAGDFHLVEYLGGSADSGVFLTSLPSEAKLAIKLVVAEAAGAEARLERWKLAEGLSNPHLLKIIRSGRCELDGTDLLYVVMECAEENLSQILPQRPLTTDETREMLPPVLDALDYLNGKGWAHGDLKPGNVMAVGDQLKLSADSVMRNGEAVSALTPYDAPEARQGVSAASDVWSLGLTLVEVLTQRLPRSAEAGEISSSLPEPFRGIVQHCLLSDPTLRWKTTDIRQYLKTSDLKTPGMIATPGSAVKEPVAAATSAVPVRRSGVSMRYVVPAAVLAIVVGGIVLVPELLKRRSEPETPVAATKAVPTQEASEPAVPATTPKTQPIARPTATETQKTRASEAAESSALKAVGSENHDERIVDQPVPDVPRKALNTIDGKVRVKVKVKVDREGKVVDSEFASAGPSKYFANLAMQAARQWRFSPSESEARAWNLQFEFRRTGINVVPKQVDR